MCATGKKKKKKKNGRTDVRAQQHPRKPPLSPLYPPPPIGRLPRGRPRRGRGESEGRAAHSCTYAHPGVLHFLPISPEPGTATRWDTRRGVRLGENVPPAARGRRGGRLRPRRPRYCQQVSPPPSFPTDSLLLPSLLLPPLPIAQSATVRPSAHPSAVRPSVARSGVGTASHEVGRKRKERPTAELPPPPMDVSTVRTQADPFGLGGAKALGHARAAAAVDGGGAPPGKK